MRASGRWIELAAHSKGEWLRDELAVSPRWIR
jgi:hypothetical protein